MMNLAAHVELPSINRYGAGIDATSPTICLSGTPLRVIPMNFSRKVHWKPLFGLMAKFYVMDGWWTDVRWANKTNLILASGDGATQFC